MINLGRFVYQVRKLIDHDNFSDADFGQSTEENRMAHLAIKLCNKLECSMCVVSCDTEKKTAAIIQRIIYLPTEQQQ